MFDLIGFLQQYWEMFLALAGVAALIPPVVNLLKILGVVGEGEGAKFASIINTVLFLAFVGVNLFLPGFDVGGIDAVLGQVAKVLVVILTLLGQFGISSLTYGSFWRGRFGKLGFFHS